LHFCFPAISKGEGKKLVAWKGSKGTKLKVFSGKEARLNLVILSILRSKKLLTKYDVFLQIRRIKGFKHEDSKTVYRRIDALEQEKWIAKNGTRPAKVQGESTLYEITLRGKAAVILDEKT
jgi:DNA-binding PadR family transcriptional regulator